MQLSWWKSITFHQRTGEDSCLERMRESGNKGCNNWKRIEYYCIKTFTKLTLETCMHVSKRHYVTKGIFNVNGDYGQLTQDQLFTRGTQRIVSVEYLFGRPVIASNFRLGKCHVELS